MVTEQVYAAKRELLRRFALMCRENKIEYFAFSKLLTGCIYYHDLIPDNPEQKMEVGMLRNKYNRYVLQLCSLCEKYGLKFIRRSETSGLPLVLPKIGLAGDAAAAFEKEYIVYIYLSPFDKVPLKRDYRYGYLKTVKKYCDKFMALEKNAVCPLDRSSDEYRHALRYFRKMEYEAGKYAGIDSNLYIRSVYNRSKSLFFDQIYPLGKEKFLDFELSIPADFSVWTTVMDDKLKFQIESIQKVDLEILKEVGRVCDELGIGYFICGGSMLGYVRNGGFIPWDDDIDIGMLRADYDRFRNEAGALLSDRFFLQTRESDPEIPYLFTKVRMNDTEYITDYNYGRNFHKGICLDIFPFDFIPEGEEEREQFKAEADAAAAAHNLIVNMRIPEPHDGKLENFEDLVYRAERKVNRLRYHLKSLKKSQARYIKTVTRLNATAKEQGLTTVASFVPTYTFIKLEDLLPYRDVVFEGVKAKIPAKAEVFLTMQYGDYMQLPPPHHQVGHPLIRWSVDTKKKIHISPGYERRYLK